MWCWGEHGRAVHHVPLRGRPRPRRADGRAGQPAVRRGVRRVRRPGNDDGTEGRRVGERHGPAAAPHRSGEVRQITLKRGMTSNLQLWQWFARGTRPGSVLTAHGQITMWDSAGTPAIQFTLE